MPRLPTAVLATGVMLLAFLSLGCGFVLDTVTRGRTEMKRLHYLSLPAPGASLEAQGLRWDALVRVRADRAAHQKGDCS